MTEDFATYLQQRVGQERAKDDLEKFKDLLPLIEEANEITQELRGEETHELVFKPHMLMEIMDNEEKEDAIVALRSVEKPDDVVEGELIFDGERRAPKKNLISVWRYDQFHERLEAMRDLYDEVVGRDFPWTQGYDLDPWGEDLLVKSASHATLQEPEPD